MKTDEWEAKWRERMAPAACDAICAEHAKSMAAEIANATAIVRLLSSACVSVGDAMHYIQRCADAKPTLVEEADMRVYRAPLALAAIEAGLLQRVGEVSRKLEPKTGDVKAHRVGPIVHRITTEWRWAGTVKSPTMTVDADSAWGALVAIAKGASND